MAEKINITHHYDEDADILYVDFGVNEPCFTEDIDGFLMVEIGWFSHLPRGIKIISPRAHKVQSVQMVISKAEKACRKLMRQTAKQINNNEPVLQDILEQRLTQAFAGIG